MASLLSLPTEIRTIILEYAINTSQPAPTDPWTGEEHRKRCADFENNSWRFGLMHTLYGPTPRHFTSTSFQLVNRQVHDETRHILNRMTHPRYDLDVMVVHEWDFWPTWTNVPVWRTHADEVNVTFRLFGHCASPALLRTIGGAGGNPGMEWCFYALLERFLIRGPINQLPNITPGNSTTQRKSERRLFMHILNLNIESAADDKHPLPPPEITEKDYTEYCSIHRSRRIRTPYADLSVYAVRPEWFARSLCNELLYVLRMSYYTLYLGDIQYEHIGVIRVLVDGRVYEEFNLAERLAPMKWDCPIAALSRAERREFFWRWKRNAQRTRQKMGFPVIMMEHKEFEEYPESETSDDGREDGQAEGIA